jgi:arsenate reductase-like glutaredoxin family protein
LDQLIGARDHLPFLNSKNEVYREREMKLHPPSRAEAIELMSKNSSLIKRPLLIDGKNYLFGFKPEEWSEGGKKA